MIRFKTEAELLKEYGKDFRRDSNMNMDGRMDYLFGKEFPGIKSTSFIYDSWHISPSMLVDDGKRGRRKRKRRTTLNDSI